MLEIPDELFELCLRALHHAPADKPSRALLEEMHGDPEGLRKVIAIAYQAGVESAPWHYAVENTNEDLVDFGSSLQGAMAYAEPNEEFPRQLTVLRQRRGEWQTAVIPDAS